MRIILWWQTWRKHTATYLFPPALAITDMRPGLVVFSTEKREATLVELTNFEDAQQRKQSKYHDIIEEARTNGDAHHD